MNISSSTAQGSESLEKSLCARQKAKNQYWTMELPGPSGGTALKQAWFCHWTHCIDSGTLSEIIFCDAVPSTTAGYSSIMHRRRHMWTWSRNIIIFSGSSKLIQHEMRQSGKLTIWINMDATFPTMKKRGTIQLVHSFQFKTLHGMVSAYEIGIYISKKHINSGKYIQVLKPHMFLSFRPYFITASIPTACVAVEESRCWSCVPAVQTFHQLKIFGKSWNEKHNKEDPELLEKKTFVKRMWIRCWVYEIYKWLDSVCICILHSNPTFSGLGLYIIDLSAFLLLVCHRQQMLLLYLHSSWWSSMAKCLFSCQCNVCPVLFVETACVNE